MSWAARVRQFGQEPMLKQGVKQRLLLIGVAFTLTSGIGAAMSLMAPAPLLVQSGYVDDQAGEQEIYYPYAYKLTPHLDVGYGKVIRQEPDRFTLLIEPRPEQRSSDLRDLNDYTPAERRAFFQPSLISYSWRAEGVPLTDPRPFWETMPGWGWICLVGMVVGAGVMLWSFRQPGTPGSVTRTAQGTAAHSDLPKG